MKKTESVLKSFEKKIKVKLKDKNSPSEFFQNRKGLFIWSSFRENISEKAKETMPGAEFKLDSFKLTKASTDEEIENSLPKQHLFSETDVCAIIADLIEKQPKGEEGTLLNNGYANLFYTKSHVVRVYWYGYGWYVYDGYRFDSWRVGSRVFSPATDA